MRAGGVSISLSYGGRHVARGQRLTPAETRYAPLIFLGLNPGPALSGPAPPLWAAAAGGPTYSVMMIDRRASRPDTSSPLLIYVHYWAVMAPGPILGPGPGPVLRILAPYQRPAPHDTLVHRYELLVFDNTALTTAAPAAFLFDPASRYVPALSSLVPPAQPLLASTFFVEHLSHV